MNPPDENENQDERTDTRDLIINAIFNSGSWLVNVFVAFVTTPYFVYKLGSDGYGVFALMTGLIGYYGLLDLGLGQGVTKFVAEYRTQDDEEALSASINAALLVQAVVGVLASLLIVVFAEQVLLLLNLPEGLREEARLGIYICSGGFFFQMIANTFVSALKGIQRYDLTSKVYVVVDVAKNVGIATVLFAGLGLVAAFWVAAGASTLSFLINLIVARREIPRWALSEGVSVNYTKRLFDFSGFLFISKISGLFEKYISRFFVSYFLGPSAVTYFVVPQKVTSAAGGILGRGFEVVFPYASELQALRDPERVRRLLLRGSRMLASLAFPGFLFIVVFAKPLLTYWMGAEFSADAWHILCLLAVTSLFGGLTTVTNQIAIGLGYTRLKSLFSVSEIIVYTTLLVLLTPRLEVAGAVGAILLTTLTVGYAFVFYFAVRILDLNATRLVKETVGMNVIPLILSPLLLILINQVMEANLARLIPTALVLAGGYLVLLVASERLPLRRLIRFVRQPSSE